MIWYGWWFIKQWLQHGGVAARGITTCFVIKLKQPNRQTGGIDFVTLTKFMGGNDMVWMMVQKAVVAAWWMLLQGALWHFCMSVQVVLSNLVLPWILPHWRDQCFGRVQASSGCHDVTWHNVMSYDVMWRHLTSNDVMWHQMMSYSKSWFFSMKYFNVLQYMKKIEIFSDWWPWTLTFDLDHRTHLRYSQGSFLYQILGP